MDEKINSLFKNKNLAVAGGLGSIGSELVKELLEYEVRSLVIVDNRETELAYRMFNISDEQT